MFVLSILLYVISKNIFWIIIQSRKDIHSEPLVVTSACGALDPLKDDSTELANLLDETSQQHYLSIWPGELLLLLPLFQKIKSTWFDVYLYERVLAQDLCL